jgi:Tfp pilus assembly protein PilN
MAVLINLLPDLRQEKLRNKQLSRLAKLIAGGIVGVCLALVGSMYLITLGQNVKSAQLSSQITQKRDKINSVADLQKILTVQQHLESLDALYKQKTYVSKFYQLLSSLEPKEVSIRSLNLDQQRSLTLNASARNYLSVAKFMKALEASNLSLGFGAKPTNAPYFSGIKVNAVTADSANQVSFSLTATISPEVTSGPK